MTVHARAHSATRREPAATRSGGPDGAPGPDPAAAASVALADRGARTARVAATLAFLAGLVNLVSAAIPAERVRLRAIRFLTPDVVSDGAVVAVAALGVALMLLAGGLRRRNRLAWAVTVALLAASALFHLVKGLDVVETVVQAALAGWLLGQQRWFTARPGPRERRRVLGPALAVVLTTTLYGLLGLAASEPGLIGRVGLGRALADVARMAVGLGSDLPLQGRFADVFPPSVAALFWVGVLIVLVRAMAPRARVRGDAGPTAQELADSDDSLAYFASRDDRIAARDGAGVVSYGVAGAVALAAGDPIGPPESWPGAIAAYADRAAAQGRVPAVIGCSEGAMEAYERAGLHRVYLGDEAVLELTDFDVEAKGRQHARRGWTRGRRDGLQAEVRRSGTLDAATVAELTELSDRWRGGSAERGFSMSLGRLFDPRDAECVVVIGRDGGGGLVGFLNLVPWARDGASLDVMRRDKSAPSVMNEFLIVEAARQLPALGVTRLSLNFAFLRGLITAADVAGASLWTRVQAWFLRRMDAVVPDRVPLPVQPEVRAGVGAALLRRAVAGGHAPGGDRDGPGGGLRGEPGTAAVAPEADRYAGAGGRPAGRGQVGGAAGAAPGSAGLVVTAGAVVATGTAGDGRRGDRRRGGGGGPRGRPGHGGRGDRTGAAPAAQPGGAGPPAQAGPAAGRAGWTRTRSASPARSPWPRSGSAGSGWPRARRPTTRSGSPGGSCSGTRSAG